MRNYIHQQGLQRRTIDSNPRSFKQMPLNEALQMHIGCPSGFPIQKYTEFSDKGKAKKAFATFVTERHFEAINERAGSGNYVLAIRETGQNSIDRINEGKALPKPHSVLDKSIKSKEDETELKKMGISLESVKGYVGYRGDNGKKPLNALVTNIEIGKEDDAIKKIADEEFEIAEARVRTEESREETMDECCGMQRTDRLREINDLKKKSSDLSDNYKQPFKDRSLEPYKINVCSGDIEHVCIPLKSVPVYQEYAPDTWEKLLYTGDYDINEVYDNGRKLITDGEGQAKMLNIMNGITDPSKLIKTKEGSALLENVPQDAIFQHGDQATYPEYFEAEKEEDEKIAAKELSSATSTMSEEMKPGVDLNSSKFAKVLAETIAKKVKHNTVEKRRPNASLLKSDPGKLAWFDKGKGWLTSNDWNDHIDVRKYLKLNPPSRDTSWG